MVISSSSLLGEKKTSFHAETLLRVRSANAKKIYYDITATTLVCRLSCGGLLGPPNFHLLPEWISAAIAFFSYHHQRHTRTVCNGTGLSSYTSYNGFGDSLVYDYA